MSRGANREIILGKTKSIDAIPNQGHPLALIEAVNNADPLMAEVFTKGGCFQLFVILQSVFAGARAFIDDDKGHVVTWIEGVYYDINGAYPGEDALREMSRAEQDTASRWRFSKNMAVGFKKCIHCLEYT